MQAIEMAARTGVLEQAFQQIPGLQELVQTAALAPVDRSQEVQALLAQHAPDGDVLAHLERGRDGVGQLRRAVTLKRLEQ